VEKNKEQQGINVTTEKTILDVASLYERYGGMVLRRCQSILKNEQRAMDALQDVFVQLLQQKTKLTANGLSSLLYTIATNVSLNMLRHQRLRDDDQTSVSVEHDVAFDELSTETQIINLDRIMKELNRFPARTQEVALYYYVDGFTMDEIANMMHMSNSNTRRLLRELRQVIPQTEVTP
jgi:RNA polymerase sigma-70 factor (ECF subfamily)